MKIAIYDWALHFIGGGQRYMCQIAQILSQYHKVHLISEKLVSKKYLVSAYNIDLRKVKLICLEKVMQNLKKKRQNIEDFKHYYKLGKDFSIQHRNFFSLYEKIRDKFFDFIKNKEIENLYNKLTFRIKNLIQQDYSANISDLSKNYDIFINGEGGKRWYINPKAKKNIMFCHFPEKITYYNQNFIKNYEIYCNSNYTKKWIIRLWKVTPKGILYPPVSFFQTKSPKKNYILYTARFMPIREQKRQSSCIKAFIELYNEGFTDYELHLIGGTVDIPSQDIYLKKLFKLAKGYPIYFHINVDQSVLGEYYKVSKFFWNLTGLNVDENQNPKFIEHFGMTTVESMQNYCVPIVFNKGGLREIIDNNVNGFLVDDIDSLIKKTKFLIENDSVRKEMALKAFTRGKEFSLKNLKIRLLKIINAAR